MFDTSDFRDQDATWEHTIASPHPGPQLAAHLDQLDLTSLDQPQLFDALQAWARIESWVAARKAQVIATLSPDDSTITPEGYELAKTSRELVAAALTIAPRAAENEVNFSHHLTAECLGTMTALQEGRISPRASKILVEETYGLTTKQISQVEDVVLSRGSHKIPSRIARDVRRTIHSLLPHREAEKHEDCKTRRSVTLIPQPHGMATVEAYLPAPEAVALYNSLTEVALINKRRDRNKCGSQALDAELLAPLTAYRADALCWLGSVACGTLEIETNSGANDLGNLGSPERFQAHVVLDLPTALGLANNPAELAQYGPIPGAIARELAATSHWEAWIVNANRQLIGVGSKSYQPSPALRRFILSRDQICQFPGCSTRAINTDLDHSKPYHNGGKTDQANLHCLCRRHHRMKTHTKWSSKRTPAPHNETRPDLISKNGPVSGTINESHFSRWTLPSGHTIDIQPEPILPQPSHPPSTPTSN